MLELSSIDLSAWILNQPYSEISFQILGAAIDTVTVLISKTARKLPLR